jgi:hypothetical protein
MAKKKPAGKPARAPKAPTKKPTGAARTTKKAPSKKPGTTRKVKPPSASAGAKKAPAGKSPGKAPAARPKPAAPGAGPNLYALVIGCDLYLPNQLPEGSYPSLNGCVRDAEQVEQFLRDRAGLSDDRLIKLTSSPDGAGAPKEPQDRRPTYENIVGAFRALTERARRGDHVYVHYSGHGSQCPTILPKIKGPEGLDEGLVPIDIGNTTARYVRDVEIAKLLREMTDKGLTVTVVFDSCHSGGATRAAVRSEPDVAVRGGLFIDRTPRPTASLVGTLAELAAAFGPGQRGPGASRGMAATAEASGSVFLAACRPDELAREASFDGVHTQGALTYWYLNTVSQGAAGLTFRTIYDTVQARIHSRFTEQTPMFIGDLDRPILGGAATPAAAAIPVDGADASGRTITLRAGQASLIRVGNEFAIYAPEAKDLTDAKARLAVVRVTSVGAASSVAEVTSSFGRKVQLGDRAVPVGVAQKLVRSVRTALPDKAPPAAAQALRRVEAALKGENWLELAPADGTADFVVTTTADGKMYQICDTAAVPLLIRPELATADGGAAKSVVARLVHLARFQAVRGLDNSDSFSRLYGKLLVELCPAPSGYQEGEPLPRKLKGFPAGRPVRLKVDELVILAVTNRSNDTLNVVVLDLAPDWAVALVQQGERFHTLRPGESWQFSLKASLPEGVKKGKDLLKVIATIDPPPAYEMLTLPPLDRPIPRASERGPMVRGGPANPLDELLAAASADRPTRALSVASQPTSSWTVAHAEVVIG